MYTYNGTYPVSKGEVDSLSKIESLVETSMIGSGKGDHKLTFTLVSTYNLFEAERREGDRERERERERERDYE